MVDRRGIGAGRKNVKRIDGKNWRYGSKHKTKRAAEKRAKQVRSIRRKGLRGRARIIKQTKYYTVYVRLSR